MISNNNNNNSKYASHIVRSTIFTVSSSYTLECFCALLQYGLGSEASADRVPEILMVSTSASSVHMILDQQSIHLPLCKQDLPANDREVTLPLLRSQLLGLPVDSFSFVFSALLDVGENLLKQAQSSQALTNAGHRRQSLLAVSTTKSGVLSSLESRTLYLFETLRMVLGRNEFTIRGIDFGSLCALFQALMEIHTTADALSADNWTELTPVQNEVAQCISMITRRQTTFAAELCDMMVKLLLVSKDSHWKMVTLLHRFAYVYVPMTKEAAKALSVLRMIWSKIEMEFERSSLKAIGLVCLQQLLLRWSDCQTTPSYHWLDFLSATDIPARDELFAFLEEIHSVLGPWKQKDKAALTLACEKFEFTLFQLMPLPDRILSARGRLDGALAALKQELSKERTEGLELIASIFRSFERESIPMHATLFVELLQTAVQSILDRTEKKKNMSEQDHALLMNMVHDVVTSDLDRLLLPFLEHAMRNDGYQNGHKAFLLRLLAKIPESKADERIYNHSKLREFVFENVESLKDRDLVRDCLPLLPYMDNEDPSSRLKVDHLLEVVRRINIRSTSLSCWACPLQLTKTSPLVPRRRCSIWSAMILPRASCPSSSISSNEPSWRWTRLVRVKRMKTTSMLHWTSWPLSLVITWRQLASRTCLQSHR